MVVVMMIETWARRSAVDRWGMAGAAYDLVVSAAFATPFTATVVLDAFAAIHGALDLPGAPPPRLDTMSLVFVTLFGTVVVMWSIARWRRPEPLLVRIDTVGRGMFSVWFAWALRNGQTPILALFLAADRARPTAARCRRRSRWPACGRPG